jgi:RNA polymerase sigma-70 factor, ECF subfamily
MTRPMRPERLLPGERFGTPCTDSSVRVDDGMPHPRGTTSAFHVGSTSRSPQAPPGSQPTAPRRPAPPQAPPMSAPPISAPQQGAAPGAAPRVGAGATRPGVAPPRPADGPQGRPASPPPPPVPPTQAGAGTGDNAAEPPAEEEGSGSWVLVKACQAGDQQAFKELYERYQDVVFRYVLFRLGDRTLAEDLTQETFLRALRRIGSVSYQGRDIGAWFVTIARNLIFDHVKSSRYRLETTTADMVEHSPTTHGPEQQVIEGATNAELLRAIEKLNPDQQDCIRMRFLQGLSVAETAARMSRAEGAVKALQHRAVRRLAQLLPEGLR